MRANAARAQREILAIYLSQAEVKKVDPDNPIKRRVGCTVEIGHKLRRPDPQNFCKSLFDCLKYLGYLKDDSSKWLEPEMPTLEAGQCRVNYTTLTITDLD